MPKWLDYVEDKAKAGVDAVVPDVVADAARGAVNNPVVRAVSPIVTNMGGPFQNAANVLQAASQLAGQTGIPGASQASTALNVASKPRQVLTPSQVLAVIQAVAPTAKNSWDAGQNFATGIPRAVTATPNALKNAGIAMINDPVGSAKKGVGEAFSVLDAPRVKVVSDMGSQAYFMATHNGDKPNGGANVDPYVMLGNALPDSFLTRWANDPQNWPAIKQAYEQGYGGKTGGHAVWELYASTLGTIPKIMADVAFDPLNAVTGAGAFGKGVKALGEASDIAGIAKVGQGIAKTAHAVDTAGNLPFIAAGKALGGVDRFGHAIEEAGRGIAKNYPDGLAGRIAGGAIEEVGSALGAPFDVARSASSAIGNSRVANALRSPKWFGETEASKTRRTGDEMVSRLSGIGDAPLANQTIPTWAAPVEGTGQYEAILADRNTGRSYIVDPDGNPVPGYLQEGKNGQKANRKVADTMNAPDGPKPTGIVTTPTGAYDPVLPGRSAATLSTPVIDAPAPPPTLPGMAAPGEVPPASLFREEDPNGFTPAEFQQTPGQRTEAINNGLSMLAPNLSNSNITTEVERLRATRPQEAATFNDLMGIAPDGSPVPGGRAEQAAYEAMSVGNEWYPTLAEKAARDKLVGIKHTVQNVVPAFQQSFGELMLPNLSANAQRPVTDLVAELADPAKVSNAVPALMEKMAYGQPIEADEAFDALLDFGKSAPENGWIGRTSDVLYDLVAARNTLEKFGDVPLATPVPSGAALASYTPSEPSTSLLQQMRDDLTLDNEGVQFLAKVHPGMEKPLIDEYLDLLRTGKTRDQAIGELQGKLYKPGNGLDVRPGTFKKATKALDEYGNMVRQNTMYNIVNVGRGNLGDRIGAFMQLWQEGKMGTAVRQLDPRELFLAFGWKQSGKEKVAEHFTRQFDPLLAGFDRDLPGSIIGDANRFGFNDDELVLTKKLKGRSAPVRALGQVFANERGADIRNAMNASNQAVMAVNEIRGQLPDEIAKFRQLLSDAGVPSDATIEALQKRATDLRAPDSFKQGKIFNRKGTLAAFSPKDVLEVTGNKRLAEQWQAAINRMYGNSAKETSRVMFTGGKRYGIDDKIGKAFFFHYWASRSLAAQAKATVRSPRVLASYYRMIQGAMNEADENGYPDTFRGMLHYWGDTSAGWYGLFNPLSVAIPAMMFADLATGTSENADMSKTERWLSKANSLLPMTPWFAGATAALGLTENTPNLAGMTSVTNLVTDVLNWSEANGYTDFSKKGIIANPEQYYTRRVFEMLNQGARKFSGGDDAPLPINAYEPYDPVSGKMDTVREVLLTNLENELGPKEEWTNEQWDRFMDGASAIEFGGAGNEDATSALEEFNDNNMVNRLAGMVIPQGSVIRYGPRETARNDAKNVVNPDVQNAAQDERNLATASPESLALQVGQEQVANLGTERQQALYKDWNTIVYGDTSSVQPGAFVQIGTDRITMAQLQQMSEDERKLTANAYVASLGGAQDLAAYKDERQAYIEANPALATFQEYKGNVSGYEGGPKAFLAWAEQVSPQFKRAADEQRQKLRDRGISGLALDAEMEDFVYWPSSYLAFKGENDSIYDPKPQAGASASNDPMQAFPGSGGGSGYGGSGGGSNSLAGRIENAITSYQERMAAYTAAGGPATQAEGSWGYADKLKYGEVPQPSAELERYMLWAQGQPQGADTSPQAYEAFVGANSPTIGG